MNQATDVSLTVTQLGESEDAEELFISSCYIFFFLENRNFSIQGDGENSVKRSKIFCGVFRGCANFDSDGISKTVP